VFILIIFQNTSTLKAKGIIFSTFADDFSEKLISFHVGRIYLSLIIKQPEKKARAKLPVFSHKNLRWVSQTIDKNGQPSSEGIVGCRGSKKQGCPFLSRFSPRAEIIV
jgi:hypothetical protein